MARSFRESRFRRRAEVGEDVNPSAYIVNLADCMLVLACGFMVALISYWNIDVVPAQELENENLEQVDPDTLPEDVQSGGSYYIEAGTVYQDPNTGQLYMVQSAEEAEASSSDSASASSSSSTSTSASASNSGESASSSSSSAGSASSTDIANARANGAD